MQFRFWPNRKTSRTVPPSRPRRFQPCLEPLEKREVLATFLVTTTADDGVGSLREAITLSNQDPVRDQIYFNIPGGGVQTITLQRALPRITDPVTIDGYGQGETTQHNLATPNTLGAGQGTNANLSVQLTGVSSVFVGLDVAASDTVIRGLSIFGFSQAGILTEHGANGVEVLGNFVGVKADGSQPASKNGVGLRVSAGSTFNFVGGIADADRNLISGNAQQGVFLQGDANTLVNNLIGTTKLGNGEVANGGGVLVQSSNNIIGGAGPGTRNVISGNRSHGVDIFGPSAQVTGNQVLGNYIGIDATGLIKDSNELAGILVTNADTTTVSGNVIGGNNAAKNNQFAGISIGIPGAPGKATATRVTGNLIGVAADGVTAMGNGLAGILVQNAINTTIGGTTVAARNTIAGNVGDGIAVTSEGTGTLIQGNFIGTNHTGTKAQANTGNGVRISGALATVGGTAGQSNIISGNAAAGILVNQLGTALIQNNFIGLGVDGSPVGNGQQGVLLNGDNASTVAGNVISGNGSHGVDVFQSSKGDVIVGNYIGTNAAGTAAVGNAANGVMGSNSSGVIIGGSLAGAGNVISGNGIAGADGLGAGGVDVFASSNVTVAGNKIGTDFTGTVAVANNAFGVQVKGGSSGVTLGGTAAGTGNLISGNTNGGVNVSRSSNTVVAGNLIGTDVTGRFALGNGNYGVQVENHANGTTIGGTTASARNVISGSVRTVDEDGSEVAGDGVVIAETAGSTVVQGNFIGTNLDGTKALGNSDNGVLVRANQVTIGGPAFGAGNVISGNGSDDGAGVGIVVNHVATAGVMIRGNFIGTNAAGTATLGTQRIGVDLAASNGVMVADNVISGNVDSGVFIGAGSDNVVFRNRIGTDVSGNSAVANGTAGDEDDHAGVRAVLSNNLIVSGNTISGNNGEGILLQAGSNIAIQSNLIGLNRTATAALGNAGHGISVEAFESDGNQTPVTKLTIGGSELGNRISANKGAGIDLNDTNGATIQGNFIGTDWVGTVALGNGGDGIRLFEGDSSVTIGGTTAAQRNIISGNKGNGVSLLGSSATVQGNYIGLGLDGSTRIGNNGDGVLLVSSGNTVGAGNVISGNFMGVRIRGSNNLVTGNFIGTTADGLAAAGNSYGIFTDQGSGNTVQSNVISGNHRDGVFLDHQSNTKLLGNTIGLNAPGTAALANGERGVVISGGSGNVVGEIGNGNVISGNKEEGVLVTNRASGTSLQANSIGTTKDGKSAVGNGTAGVVVSVQAQNTTVGGTAAGAGNVISGNDAVGGDGVLVKNGASGTLILGNSIGLDKDGTGPLANLHGVVIQDAVNTTVGSSGVGNLISFNTLSGINLTGAGTGTLIQGNTIGLDKNGATAPNLKDGINVQGGSGTSIKDNVISGNNGNGVHFSGPDVKLTNDLVGNLIGTDPSGTAARGNGMAGVLVEGLTAEVHSLSIVQNTISGNAQEGVRITNSDEVTVSGNEIGLNRLGTAALANGTSGHFDGVHVTDSAGIKIGDFFGLPNVIAGNTRDGVRVDGNSLATVIVGNLIGLLESGAQVQANAGHGINITGKASETTIGGTDRLGTNVISGNGLHGLNIDVNTVDTTLNGNIIGMDEAARVGLGNQQDGVHVLGKGVVLSGNLNDFGNRIAGNGGNGIRVSGANASGTVIRGARVGTNGAGTAKVPNALDGILVTGEANDVEIGGPEERDGNLVSGNTRNGIEVTDAAGTLIQRNLIGTDQTGKTALGNTLAGVFLQGTDSVTVGGDNDTLKNTISANGKSGIEVKDATKTTIGFNNIGASSGVGQSPLGNGGDGVFVSGASEDTTVNHNLIAANTGSGVNFDANATGLTLTGNTISPALAVLTPGNKTGVLIKGQNATLGGTAAGQGNTIFGNATAGIDVQATAVNVTIQGNYIGTTPGNLSNGGNGTDGILVNGLARQVTIGGTAAGARNVISANKGNGIHLTNVSQTVKIEGNLIGTNDQGSAGLGNARDGVLLEATSGAIIQGNTISGNGSNGVELVNGSNSNTITANKIGVGLDGGKALGNKGFGVWAHQGTGAPSSNNTIGGTAAGAGNVIGYNAKGVVIGDSLTDSSQQNAILGSSIFQSSILIDLGNLGVPYTPTGTAGPNLLEVPPTLSSATVSGSDLTVTGSLQGTLANTTYRIEIFAADPTVGPFKRFLGFKDVTTDGSGNVVGGFSVTFEGVAVPTGAAISATATDANGNTTGFAAAITSGLTLNASGNGNALQATAGVPVVPGITVRLRTAKFGKKRRLVVEVSFADTGVLKSRRVCPFQKPAFRDIQVSVRDSNGDGVPDEVVVTAKTGKRTTRAILPV